MCAVLILCVFFSYGFTICSVCVIDEQGSVLKSYYSSSDITVALSRALDYTKKYASKYNPLTVKLSRGNYNVKNTLFLTSYTTIDLNASLIKNANFKRGNIFKSPEDKAYPGYSSLCECIIKNGTLDDVMPKTLKFKMLFFLIIIIPTTPSLQLAKMLRF